MLRTVHLHGRLGEKFGKRHRLDVDSTAEAVAALMCQLGGFESYIRHRQYVVTAGRSQRRDRNPVLGEPQLRLQLGRATDIHIVPAPLMAGVELIILGITLALVAIATIAIFTMMKAPKAGDREEATKADSFVFDGPENVIEQGHAVPLIYGDVRTGSVVVSSSITTSDIASGTDVPGGKSDFLPDDPSDPPPPTPDPSVGGGSGLVGVSPNDETAGTGGFYGRTSNYGHINLLGGGGKSGGGGDGMQEAPNSLRSNAIARVLEVISEGEIIGLLDGLKSVYLDNTPIQNADGTYNFQGATVQQRVGLPDQDYVPGFASAENTIDVSTEVSIALGPVTRTISDPDVTVARVTIRVPALYSQDTDDGDINPTAVAVEISVQADGGGYTNVYRMDINGKTNQPYDRSVDVHLPAGLDRQVRVTRLTADSTVSSLVNETHWALLTEVIEAKLSYPDSALIGLTVDARQFGTNIPARSYHVRGLIIEVPVNYNPETRVYTGIWNGTFKRAWSNNPAWILRDLVVSRRYGLGARVPVSALDKWALYAIAQYCDALVPDGFGGTQPRYTLNTVVRTKTQAYDLIAAVASNFRGWVYWGSGSIVAAQDRPEDPSVLVTRGNVVDGLISYGRVTPHERRRSVAVVYWNDPQDNFRLVPEVVERPELIRRFGRRVGQEVTAFGVTNKGQAHRLAEFILEDEAEASNTVAQYQVGDDHAFVAPGRVAMVADPMFTQNRRGGRVKASTVGGVTLDASYTFVAGQVYSLRTMLPDGTVSVRPITNAPGTATVVTLGGANWTGATKPNPGAVWTIETNVVANRQFRVRQIETDRPPYRVKAVLHDPTKYARVELDRDLETPNYIMIPNGPLLPPTALGVFEFLQAEGTAWVPCALFSWTPGADPRVMLFQAQAKGPTGDWFDLGAGLEPTRTIRGASPGLWLFRVRGVDGLGRSTDWQMGDATLDGQTDALPEVVAPGITVDDGLLSATLIWDKPADTRPLRYEIMYSAGGGYGTAVSLGTTDQLSFPITIQGNYWVRTFFIGYTSPAPVLVNASALIFSAGIVPHLTRETVSLPATSSGTVTNYTNATGTYKIYSGSTDISASFTLSTPAGGNPQALTHAYVGRDYSVTAGFDAAEPTAQLRIRATGSGAYAGVVLDKDFTLTKAQQGAQGDYVDMKFKRSNAKPATPTVPDPAGWEDEPPAGTATLWFIKATKTFIGDLLSDWSDPTALSGLSPRGAYSGTDTYYLGNTVTYNGGTYVGVQDNFSGQAPSGNGNATAYWDVLAAPGSAGEPGTPPSAFSATINLTSGAAVNLRSVADANGYTGLSNATVTFKVPNGVICRGLGGSTGAPGGYGIDTGVWPAGYTIALTLVVESGGIVDGGGGGGGNGANVAGYPGGAAGDAIYVRQAMSGGITINAGGTVRGGGGGGSGGAKRKIGGFSGDPDNFDAPETWGGGGGGGGFPNGAGGEGGYGTTASGANGSAGTTGGGGAGGDGSWSAGSPDNDGGAGGNAATAGAQGTNYLGAAVSTGGAAGYAVRKNGHAAAVTNNGTMTGTAA